jgi:hypothetical protein
VLALISLIARLRHAELGPRIGITCWAVLGLEYFVLVVHTFGNHGEVGGKAYVVQRPADVTIELETSRRA